MKVGKGTISAEGYSETTFKVKKDTELTIIATTEDNTKYELKELKANGVDIKATMKFVVTADTKVTAVFGEKVPASVEDPLLASISVAPNPFSTQLRIINPTGISVRYELVNLMGTVLRSGEVNGSEHLIETSTLVNGIYFVRLETLSGATKTINVVKEK